MKIEISSFGQSISCDHTLSLDYPVHTTVVNAFPIEAKSLKAYVQMGLVCFRANADSKDLIVEKIKSRVHASSKHLNVIDILHEEFSRVCQICSNI